MASRFRGPFRAFRMARKSHPLFDGSGAALNGGRWNAKGQRIIYGSESYAGALLEILVHSNLDHVPPGFDWIEIGSPAEVEIEEVSGEELPGWNAPDFMVSRDYGSRWYREQRTPVLLVPSVASGGVERNVLINQEHRDFSLILASPPREVKWDERLFARRPRE